MHYMLWTWPLSMAAGPPHTGVQQRWTMFQTWAVRVWHPSNCGGRACTGGVTPRGKSPSSATAPRRSPSPSEGWVTSPHRADCTKHITHSLGISYGGKFPSEVPWGQLECMSRKWNEKGVTETCGAPQVTQFVITVSVLCSAQRKLHMGTSQRPGEED